MPEQRAGRSSRATLRDRLLHALAAVAGLVAVAQLEGLVLAGRGAGGDGRPAEGAAVELAVHLEGGVAAGIEDLAGLQGRRWSAWGRRLEGRCGTAVPGEATVGSRGRQAARWPTRSRRRSLTLAEPGA